MLQSHVIHGDCLQVLPTLPAQSVDFVLTDPPYLVRYRDRSGRSIANDDRSSQVLDAFADLYRVLKPDTFCVSLYGWSSVAASVDAWHRAGFREVEHRFGTSGTRHGVDFCAHATSRRICW